MPAFYQKTPAKTAGVFICTRCKNKHKLKRDQYLEGSGLNKQVSPFAALTGAEKQIRWLEYQSIRLPYIEVTPEVSETSKPAIKPELKETVHASAPANTVERPQPPPEVPRTIPADYQRTRHSQYDAVIARLKQAELQSRYYGLQSSEQGK